MMGVYKEKFSDWLERHGAAALTEGGTILVPAYNGRRSRKRTGYAKLLNFNIRQSGEAHFLVEQSGRRLEFTQSDLDQCWSRTTKLVPRVG